MVGKEAKGFWQRKSNTGVAECVCVCVCVPTAVSNWESNQGNSSQLFTYVWYQIHADRV